MNTKSTWPCGARKNWRTPSRPGRFHDGPGAQCSAVDDTGWHQLDKIRFAKSLAEDLFIAARAGKSGTLLIAASRPVLGARRDEMHPEVADKLILDMPMVLTSHPLDEKEPASLREPENADGSWNHRAAAAFPY